jgi:hypothetical protein
MAELGPALFLLFIILFFPLVCLGTLGMRYTFLIMTVRQAARDASRCRTFQNNSGTNLSSKNAAIATVTNWFSHFPGVKLANNNTATDIRTYIQIYNRNTNAITFSNVALTQAQLNTTNNWYNIGVSITATVEPLFENNQAKFGNIPGLTAPFPVTAVAAAVCENTDGLTQ